MNLLVLYSKVDYHIIIHFIALVSEVLLCISLVRELFMLGHIF